MKQAASRVIGYVRVSTDEQAKEGASVRAQPEKIRLYCELHGLELVATFDDPGVSAKTIDRPGLTAALAMLDTGQADGLVVTKLDRLTRSLADWSDLIERYFRHRDLMSVSESIDTRTAGGRMVLNLLVLIAQWERETIVERTQGGMDFKRSKGEVIGTVPIGSKRGPDGVSLVADPAELAAIAAVTLLSAEGLSLRKIAARLDADGIPTRTGRPWSASTVRSLLNRKAPDHGPQVGPDSPPDL